MKKMSLNRQRTRFISINLVVSKEHATYIDHFQLFKTSEARSKNNKPAFLTAEMWQLLQEQ